LTLSKRRGRLPDNNIAVRLLSAILSLALLMACSILIIILRSTHADRGLGINEVFQPTDGLVELSPRAENQIDTHKNVPLTAAVRALVEGGSSQAAAGRRLVSPRRPSPNGFCVSTLGRGWLAGLFVSALGVGVDEELQAEGRAGRGRGGNREADFRRQTRSSDTHASTTDLGARLYRKGPGKEANNGDEAVLKAKGDTSSTAC
jgi:hypothetical protein